MVVPPRYAQVSANSLRYMTERPRTIAEVDRAVVKESLGKRVVPVHELVGGTHATTWLVAIEGSGEGVLQEFPSGDPWVSSEAMVLAAVDVLGGLAPRLMAQGVDNQCAWLLLTRVPGTADITSMNPRTVAMELGTALARVHRVDVHRLAYLRTVYETNGLDRSTARVLRRRHSEWTELSLHRARR